VSIAMDELKRHKVAAKIADVQALDPKALIASDMLMDYVLGECSAADALEVEMAAAYFPTVAAELGDLLQISEALILQGAVTPPAGSKRRFSDFLTTNAMPADGWNIIMPALSSVSSAADFEAWIGRINPDAIMPQNNLNVFPLDAAPHALTLFVVVKEQLEEEVHLDSIERFLVLEGTCVIELEDEKIYLKAGDYYSVPKFTPHTVVVTSDIPCKLIVQQVAA
jgi:mannose-6-phosphate isomerase-like protein (cupin superfamily)